MITPPMKRTTSPDCSTSSRSALIVPSCVFTSTGLFGHDFAGPGVDDRLLEAAPRSRSMDMSTTSRLSVSMPDLRLNSPSSADITNVLLSAVSILARTTLQLDHVRLGDVLRRGLRDQFVPALVAGVAAELGRFHGDLGARDHELAGIDRQPRQNPHRIEPATSTVAPRISTITHRDRQAQQPHPPAVTHGALERARFVAPLADGEAAASVSSSVDVVDRLLPRDQTRNRRNRQNRPDGDVHTTVRRLKIGCEYGPVAAKPVTNGRKCPRPPSRRGQAGPGRAGSGSRPRPARRGPPGPA